MGMCKVWNKNFLPFKQKFEDEMIAIDAGRFIIMDAEKAHMFQAAWSPIEVDAGNVPKPSSYKMIVLEAIDSEEVAKVNLLRCLACAYIGKDKKDLTDHGVKMHGHQLASEDNHLVQHVERKERERKERYSEPTI